MIAGDSNHHVRGAALKHFMLTLGVGLCAALPFSTPGYAQDNPPPVTQTTSTTTTTTTANSPADPISATFNKAASNNGSTATPAAGAQPANAPAANPAPNPNANSTDTAAQNGNLPPLPTDKESLQTLTNALAADKSGIAEQDQQTKAFNNALNGIFPLTPEQIKEVMRRMSESQEAGRAPPAPDPTATVKVENVSLEPGVTPPLIAVSTGYVTTVNLLDVTGQPWPIQDVVVGGNFQVTGPNDGNVLRIIPQTRFGKGNLSVRLVGLSTPVTFRVESGGPEVYYRYDARIPQSGPAAKQSLIDHGYAGEAGNATLLAVLDGMPPKDSKKMIISGADGRTRGYKLNDQVYLRTPLTLLSPGWDASVRSADGTNVYMLSDTPVLMLSDNGQMIRAKMSAPPEDAFMPTDLKEGKVTVAVNADGTVATPAGAQTAATPQPLANQASLNAVTQAAATGAAAGSAAAQTNAQTATAPLPLNRPNSNVQIYSNGSYPSPGANTTNIIYPNNAATTNNTNGGVK